MCGTRQNTPKFKEEMEQTIIEAFKPFHQSMLDLIVVLVEMNPLSDTPEGRLLDGLAMAVETYELAIYDEDLRLL